MASEEKKKKTRSLSDKKKNAKGSSKKKKSSTNKNKENKSKGKKTNKKSTRDGSEKSTVHEKSSSKKGAKKKSASEKKAGSKKSEVKNSSTKKRVSSSGPKKSAANKSATKVTTSGGKKKTVTSGKKATAPGKKKSTASKIPSSQAKKKGKASGKKGTSGSKGTAKTNLKKNVAIKSVSPSALTSQSSGRVEKSLFSRLEISHPLLLLPLRLETRFYPRKKPRKLQVRIYPDQIHIDDHVPSLSEGEAEAGKSFWQNYNKAKDEEGKRTAWLNLAALTGPRRALWVYKATEREGRGPAAGGEDFSLASLLPQRWAALGYIHGKEILKEWSLPVDSAIFTAFSDPASLEKLEEGDSPVEEGMEWMVRFDKAVKKGMALEVDLGDSLADIKKYGLELLVLGVESRLDPSGGAEKLEKLLHSHCYTRGLDFIPQGTPTNNTEAVEAGWSSLEPDGNIIYEKEFGNEKTSEIANGKLVKEALGLTSSLLEKLPRSGLEELGKEKAMNTLLWPVTWGEYLGELLKGSKNKETFGKREIESVRRWFIDRVRGGTPLPVLQVGSQPYGLLPVTTLPKNGSGSGVRKHLPPIIDKLRLGWQFSLRNVPRLDPTNQQSGEESLLTKVLSSQPLPWQFSLRQLELRQKSSGWGSVATALIGLPGLGSIVGTYDLFVNAFGNKGVYEKLGYRKRILSDLKKCKSIDDQIALFSKMKKEIESLYQKKMGEVADLNNQVKSTDKAIKDLSKKKGLPSSLKKSQQKALKTHLKNLESKKKESRELKELAGGKNGKEKAISLCDQAVDWLRKHRSRLSLFLNLGLSSRRLSTLLGADDGKIFYSLYGSDSQSWEAPLVKAPEAGGKAGDYLAWLAKGGKGKAPPSLTAPHPLLYQLVKRAVPPGSASKGDKEEFSNALVDLSTSSDEELERLLKQTLALAGHRLDAWATSLARSSLDQLRSQKKRGIQIGAFGRVEGLKPEGEEAVSEGFIHAPSLHHATTAALLRSGWLSQESREADAPMAVNLTSERVRISRWLMAGVREGQDLGDMVGYRFERELHEKKLDHMIKPCREAVIQWLGEDGDPLKVVDGLDFLEATEEVFFLQGLYKEAGKDKENFKNVVSRLSETLDALNDSVTAESLHHLAGGNFHRASATLNGVSDGETPPPEMRTFNSPRTGVAVTHRIQLLLPDKEDNALWHRGERAKGEPRLEAWAAKIFGPPEKILCKVFREGDRKGKEVSMATLSWSALDALFATDGQLRERINYFCGEEEEEVTVDFDPQPLGAGGAVSFEEHRLLAGAARKLVARATPLNGGDFVQGGEEVPTGIDLREADSRIATALATFEKRLKTLRNLCPLEGKSISSSQRIKLERAMVALWDYNFHGTLPGKDEDLSERGVILLEEGEKRLKELIAAKKSSVSTEQEHFLRADRQGKLLFGSTFSLIPLFVVENPEELDATFKRNKERLAGDPYAVDNWVQKVAPVRAGASRLAKFLGIQEALGGGIEEIALGQLPDYPGEPWVGMAKPDSKEGGGRLSLVSLGAASVNFTDNRGKARPLCGLAIDQWVEKIPSKEETTGVAFHFDAPGSKAPQSLLLATVPKGESRWSLDILSSIVRETFNWAKLRMVGPETLTSYGHHLPAVFPQGTLDPGEKVDEEGER